MNDILALCLQLASAAAATVPDSGLPALLPAGLMTDPARFLRLPDAADRLCTSLCRLSAFRPAGGPVPEAARDLMLGVLSFVCLQLHPDACRCRIPAAVHPSDSAALFRLLMSFLSVSTADLELGIRGEKFLRLWSGSGCTEMNNAYHIQARLSGIRAVGDDEGGFAIVLAGGGPYSGLYALSFGNLDADGLIFLAPSLPAFLFGGVGWDIFLDL